ncbi:MAG TPA: dipicolinate synthase subunit DpsA, partial [Bacillota bacterium]|nr:dipicolinate synthase subunit DpsA [Bacillota bacterium]
MFQDLVVIIIGGDCREVELYRCWKESGPVVKMLGFEEAPEIPEADLAEKEDLERARVLIAPLSGIKENGSVLSRYS